ncbi:MAG: hypothetical protein JRF08_02590 [Deltaproteobacteria bacterium]|nr:hypothetical protein [Deltaproteobacteria bacterium]MBW2105196.1 hypothetical protein [Deltaproteobacteria bacterium]MBW2332368.1 hypothetical protein [Deltaproteobacteria bacterium]RLB21732.1 MAG: hypothetical protein DRG73_08030 [Deltaproteobacteria bacterium]
MPGYQLVEIINLSDSKPKGIAPYENDIGLLDFLRELRQDSLPFPKFHRLQVRGLEDVLFAARPNHEEMALKIRRLLRKGAQDLERRLIEVQFIFQGKLIRGDTLWIEYRNTRLPIGHIFGLPIRQTDANDNPFYKTNFHLSNG